MCLPTTDPGWAGHSDDSRAAPRHPGPEQGWPGVRLPRAQATCFFLNTQSLEICVLFYITIRIRIHQPIPLTRIHIQMFGMGEKMFKFKLIGCLCAFFIEACFFLGREEIFKNIKPRYSTVGTYRTVLHFCTVVVVF